MIDFIEGMKKMANDVALAVDYSLESKDKIYEYLFAVGDEEAEALKTTIAYSLYGLLNNTDLGFLKGKVDTESNELSRVFVSLIIGTLKEEGQDYYLEKLIEEGFSMKYVMLHAVHKFGDERFIQPCNEYLKKQMELRPTMEEIRAFIQGRSKKKIKDQQEYLLNLSDVLAIIEYFKRVDSAEYNQALELLLNNADLLEARERRYLHDEHGLEFDDYQ